jgi:hypothetical protein
VADRRDVKMEANMKFSSSIGQIESNYDEVTDSFDAMDLKPELLRGMYHSVLSGGGPEKKY